MAIHGHLMAIKTRRDIQPQSRPKGIRRLCLEVSPTLDADRSEKKKNKSMCGKYYPIYLHCFKQENTNTSKQYKSMCGKYYPIYLHCFDVFVFSCLFIFSGSDNILL